MLQFQRFNPAPCQFPPPRAALLPALRWHNLAFGPADVTPPAVLEGAGVWHFSRGRYALEAAYRAAGIGPAGALLAPSYHCRTMLDPALALRGAIDFYALNSDLTPQMDSIEEAVARQRQAVRALVIPHYFGFEQPLAAMRELAEFCRREDITLIEDCSHAWIVATQRAALCRTATKQMVVASPYKFFACADGGTLWGNPAQLNVAQQSRPPLRDELKAFKSAFDSGAPTRPASPPHRMAADGPVGQPGEDLIELSDQPSRLYCPALEGRSSLAMSRWVMRRTMLDPVVQRRRANYRTWADAVGGLQNARPLFPELAADGVPYMFPLYISAPDQQFFKLKQSGLPIWRWDEMAVTNCPVASKYRLHLLHLPCHQSLTAQQMRWMTDTVAELLA
jgi:perosamine synthetase